MEIIKTAPTVEPKQEWISVKDRLPDNARTVIICAEIVKGRKWVSFGYFDGDEWICGSMNDVQVSYWMELPDPPEEEEVEE